MKRIPWYPIVYLVLFTVSAVGWTSYWFFNTVLDQLPVQLTFFLRAVFPVFLIGKVLFTPGDTPYDWEEDDEDQSIREEQHNLGVGPFSHLPPV